MFKQKKTANDDSTGTADTALRADVCVPIVDNWFVDYYKQKHQDPIYGEIDLLPYQQRIVATPHFDRLRDLKQMGAAHHVFTNANHTRFSHSVGVAHRAKQMYRHLTAHSLTNRYDALEEMLLVTAAMCHDLGHGPHSHAFESWAQNSFDHEQMSATLLWHAIENDYLPFLSEKALHYDGEAQTGAVQSNNTITGGGNGTLSKKRKREQAVEETQKKVEQTQRTWTAAQIKEHNFAIIRAMILGVSPGEAAKLLPPSKYWLFEIVHNQTHGIDVDKMDYLVRDMHSVYGSSSPNVRMTQIIESARIVNGRIRFNVLACNQLYEMLYLRASMHKNVYTHDSVFAVKHMFLDLLHLVDEHSEHSISRAMQSPEQFLLLSDSVFKPWNTLRHNRSDAVAALAHRIQTQQYYAVLARRILFDKPAQQNVEQVLDKVIAMYASLYGGDKNEDEQQLFSAQNLFITCTRYDLGNGTDDPLRAKIFYRQTTLDDEEECYKTEDSCSCFYDNRHTVEYLVRLFSKQPPHLLPLQKLKNLCLCFSRVLAPTQRKMNSNAATRTKHQQK